MIDIVKLEKSALDEQVAEEVYALLGQVYPVSPWTLEQIRTDMQAEASTYVVARAEGQLVAFLAWQETDFEVEVTHIAVRPDRQGQGIATALFATLPQGKEILLEVRESNGSALLFYKKEKFREIARRRAYYREPLEDAIVMKREINER